MELSENDRKILEQMQVDLERITGKKAAHVFIDTKETIKEVAPHDSGCFCVECEHINYP